MPTLQDVLDELLGAGETALTLGTGAASGAVGMPYGLYKGITGGGYGTRKGVEQAQREAQAFMERNTYIPRTKSGKQNLSAIAKILDASKLPPVIPEAVLLSSIPRAAALAQAERLGMSAEKALEAPLQRAYNKGGLTREMLLAMGQGTQSQAREAKVAGIPIRELLFPNRKDLTAAEKSAITRFEKSLSIPAVRRREEMRATGGDIIKPTEGLSLIPEMELDPSQLVGKRLVPVFGDLSPVGGDVYQVAGVPLSKPVVQQGGRRYASIQPNVDQGIAYASEPSAASNKIANFNKFADDDVLGVFFGGGPESVNFSHHMAQSFVRQLDALKPSKDAIKQFNQAIKDSFVEVADPATGKKIRKFPFKNFAGIDSPNIEELMTVKGTSDFTPGQLRIAISDAVNKAKFRDMGFPVYGDTQKVMTEQGLTPGYAGQLIFRPTKGQDIVQPKYIHDSYSAGIPGKILGGVNVVNQSKTGVPAEYLFPKLFAEQRARGARDDQILAKMRMSHQGEKFTEQDFDNLLQYMGR